MSVTTLVEEPKQRKQSRAEHHAKLGSQDETALTIVNPLSWVELHSIIPLESKANPDALSVRSITNLSADTVKRHHADKIKKLSSRREGMTLKNALEIAGISIPGAVT